MNTFARVGSVTTLVLGLFLFSGCTSVFTAGSLHDIDITGIRALEKSNGYIVEISANKKIGNVEAWLGDNNWLYITIPDTNISGRQVNDLSRSRLIKRTEIFRYPGAVQVTLQLRDDVEHVEVVRYRDSDNIYVVLYRSNRINSKE
jgi:hypothetical protein